MCRHGGAEWLKSVGVSVPWYQVWSGVTVCVYYTLYNLPNTQYHHVDIILLLMVTTLIILLCTFYFWRSVYRWGGHQGSHYLVRGVAVSGRPRQTENRE